MTTRPGDASLGLWTTGRTKRPCNLIRITRADGYVLTFSDHDRALTFGGEVYTPGNFAAMAADNRRQDLYTPEADMHAVIDGDTITIPDLMGHLYRGARVEHYLTDWSMPWLVIRTNVRTIRSVEWDEWRWVATLAGVTQVLERPTGGRFHGIQSRTCAYRLADSNCKASITAYFQRGVKVATVTDAYGKFTLTSASYTGTYADDFYRDGEIDWRWDASDYAGTADIGATSLTVSPSPNWTADEHVGKDILHLSAADGYILHYSTITANTSDTLTYGTLGGSPPFLAAPFEICALSNLTYVKSPVVKHVHSTRFLETFLPTPHPITVGMRGNLWPGCNGLFGTCKTKFSNQDNFGGAHLQPKPSDLLEVP